MIRRKNHDTEESARTDSGCDYAIARKQGEVRGHEDTHENEREHYLHSCDCKS